MEKMDMSQKIIYGATILQVGERLEFISLVCFFVFIALLTRNILKICSDSTNDSIKTFKICFCVSIIGASVVGVVICMYSFLGFKMKVIWGVFNFIVFNAYNFGYCFFSSVIENMKERKGISWQE